MRHLASSLITLCTLLLFTPDAKALYLYLDINNNPYERGAYTDELERGQASGLTRNRTDKHSRGYSYEPPRPAVYERFVSVPAIDNSSAEQMISLAKSRDASWVRYVNAGCFAAESCTAEPVGKCSALHEDVHAWERRFTAVPKTKISVDAIERQLASINLPYGETIQLAISGHYSGGSFTGNLGSISVQDIDRAFTYYPRLRAAVTKLHLLGCYTNTLSQIETTWRKPFPHARAIVGFYRQSPVGDDRKNLRFIRFLVHNNAAIDKVRTEKQFGAFMSALNRVGLPVAVAIDDLYQVTGGKRLRISEAKTRSSICAKNLKTSLRDEYLQVFRGNQELPTNTSSSPLRTYYTALRNNLECLEEPRFMLEHPNVPHPDRVIRLIFYRNTLTNFQRMHRSDIANLNSLLQSVGVEAPLSIQNINLYERKDLQAWVANVRQSLQAMKDNEAATRALRLVENFSRTIVDLDPYCVPLDWIEPSASQKSVCLSVPGECR